MLAFAWGTAAAATSVRIAVLAIRPAPEVQRQWQPLIAYLNEKIPGYHFQSEALGFAELDAAVARRSVDFVLTNPAHYVLMTYRNGLSSPLATLVPLENGKPVGKFGGVIFARADRGDLASPANLRGLTIATVSKASLGGYQAQAMELAKIGLRMPQDAQLMETDMPHDLVVDAVMDRRAAAGFVRTGVLEGMAREGKLDLAKIKVLAPKNVPGFPSLLSTRLYPQWPIAALPGVDEDLARQVAAMLLSLPHGGDLARRLDIEGFTIPTDYESVQATLSTLRLPPFDTAPQFTAEDIWNKYRWQLVTGMTLIAVIGLLTVLLLVLNRRLAEGKQRIQHASQEWHRLLTALGEGVYGVNGKGHCTFINPAALAMLGLSADEVLNRNQHELFHHHREDGTDYAAQECPVSLTLKDGETRCVEEWLWRKDGTGFPVTLTTAPMGEHRAHEGAVVIFRDISDRRRLEAQLRQEATTDPLTGAANRRQFLRLLNIELERFKRLPEPTTVLMVDIDHFKKINDTHGHATGDAVLRHLVSLSRQCLRRVDVLGRLGGEEFGILLPGTDAANALQFAERYRRLVADTPAHTDQGPIFLTVSIGVSEYEAEDSAADSALARADVALYRAKKHGRNAVELFVLDAARLESPAGDNSIIRLTWKPRYACGEQTIDKEHRQLFLLANTILEQATAPNLDSIALNRAFDALLAHVVQHFADEEEILRAHGYAHQEAHAECHKQLLERALNLRRQADASGVSVGDLVDFLVSDVVVSHMLREDWNFHGLFQRPNIPREDTRNK
jgi:diguanylate cyclase (GGDEF)-like protein/hemerythrin-like metal-binding protein/PAS domain S-box-containing protein